MTHREEFYRAILNAMSTGFTLYKIVRGPEGDADCEFIEVNPAFEALAGLKKEDIIGKTATEILPGINDDTGNLISQCGEAALQGKSTGFDHYSEPLKKWFHASAFSPAEGYLAILFNNAGHLNESPETPSKYARLMGAREERVLELKSTVNDLLKELGRPPLYRTTADTGVERHYLKSLYDTVLAGSGASMENSGTPEMGRVWDLAFNMMEDAEAARKDAEKKTEKTKQYAMELEFKNREIEDARKQAEAANIAKNSFLANMGHEIRTPLNAVIGFSDLLSSMVTDSQQKNYTDAVKKAGLALLALINDILDLTKIEAGKLDITRETVNPVFILNDLQQMFRGRIKTKNLEFFMDIPKDLPPALLLDDVRLKQILYNLLDNAVKFTHTGRILLSTEFIPNAGDPSKITLTFSVQDTGKGIPQKDMPGIFDAFKQLDGESTRQYDGTGLGLAIVKRLVEMMNGRVSVTSTVDSGSIFKITLRDVDVVDAVETPVKQALTAVQDTQDMESVTFPKARVLVVDDIKSNRFLLQTFLSKFNLETSEAENGKAALEHVKESRPDLIFMDIMMPVMDGHKAAKLLKTSTETRSIPLIALTAATRSYERDKIKESGFDGFLPKPVEMPMLFRELLRHLPYSLREKNEEHHPTALSPNGGEKHGPVRDVHNLVRSLETELQPLWEEIRGAVDMDEVEAFAKKLKSLAQRHDARVFVSYAGSLLDFAQNFDIENIQGILKKFPALMENLPKTGEPPAHK